MMRAPTILAVIVFVYSMMPTFVFYFFDHLPKVIEHILALILSPIMILGMAVTPMLLPLGLAEGSEIWFGPTFGGTVLIAVTLAGTVWGLTFFILRFLYRP